VMALTGKWFPPRQYGPVDDRPTIKPVAGKDRPCELKYELDVSCSSWVVPKLPAPRPATVTPTKPPRSSPTKRKTTGSSPSKPKSRALPVESLELPRKRISTSSAAAAATAAAVAPVPEELGKTFGDSPAVKRTRSHGKHRARPYHAVPSSVEKRATRATTIAATATSTAEVPQQNFFVEDTNVLRVYSLAHQRDLSDSRFGSRFLGESTDDWMVVSSSSCDDARLKSPLDFMLPLSNNYNFFAATALEGQ